MEEFIDSIWIYDHEQKEDVKETTTENTEKVEEILSEIEVVKSRPQSYLQTALDAYFLKEKLLDIRFYF